MGQRLVIFDVDGTLVDSQADILESMARAFGSEGLEVPQREDVLGIVGLSLNVAMPKLAPHATREAHYRLEDAYKHAYAALRAERGARESSPLYPGAMQVLEQLAERTDLLLGIATGKSRRGLDKLIEGHGLQGMFVTEHVADNHPSKPHPSMIEAALSETGTLPSEAVMVGDTTYDMDMASNAGIAAIGVSWGYHGAGRLTAAHCVIDRFSDLPDALDTIWKV